MTFRLGQRVVCVDADQAPMLKLNDIYTVKLYQPPMWCLWKGMIGQWDTVYLYEVEPNERCHGFCAERFQPYDERKTDIGVFTDMLTSMEPEWLLDVHAVRYVVFRVLGVGHSWDMYS